jgi:hypothetical protein
MVGAARGVVAFGAANRWHGPVPVDDSGKYATVRVTIRG